MNIPEFAAKGWHEIIKDTGWLPLVDNERSASGASIRACRCSAPCSIGGGRDSSAA
jgi:hypothetical protein